MHLKSLELAGFKSFAKKSALTFNAPITGVVGPNGSGKSNVAEAFRFALGEQSMKSMRGKRGEDLIWNGSPAVPRANRASVKVVFDNSRRLLNLDFDEVHIERVVHRDGVNEYLLNGSPVRLKDITELLASAHIGASGHHIISQGEADRILSASAKDRREMIEDALGLKVYHYKRLESLRKLEKTDENLKEVSSLRRELAPHLAFLKKQVARIEKGRELRRELVLRYQEYFLRERRYLDAERAAIAEGKAAPQEESAKVAARIESLRIQIAETEQAGGRGAALLLLEERLRAAREGVASLAREQGRVEGAIAAEERRIRRLEEDRTHVPPVPYQDVERFAADVSAASDAIAAATELYDAQRKAGELKTSAESFRASARGAGRESMESDSRRELEILYAQKTEVEKRLSDAGVAEAAVRGEYAALREEMDRLKDTSRTAERELFEAMGRQNDLSLQIASFRAREEKLRLEDEDYSREIGEAAAVAGRESLAYESAAERVGQEPEAREAQAARRREIEKMKIRVEEAGGAGGEDTLKEFEDATSRDAFLAREMEDLEKSAAAIRELIADLSMRLRTEFEAGLGKINAAFGDLFTLMFGGGVAKLSVVEIRRRGRAEEDDEEMEGVESLAELSGEDEAEPEQGIEVSVNLPHKRVRGLEMLSGGERALTSIALLFAISRVHPPPFIILDETDAALDEANSRKYGDMIAELSKSSQLILITHNRETMSRAGTLYGVTMGGDGVSRLLSIHLEEAVAVAK